MLQIGSNVLEQDVENKDLQRMSCNHMRYVKLCEQFLPTLQSATDVEFSVSVMKPNGQVMHMPNLSSLLSLYVPRGHPKHSSVVALASKPDGQKTETDVIPIIYKVCCAKASKLRKIFGASNIFARNLNTLCNLLNNLSFRDGTFAFRHQYLGKINVTITEIYYRLI